MTQPRFFLWALALFGSSIAVLAADVPPAPPGLPQPTLNTNPNFLVRPPSPSSPVVAAPKVPSNRPPVVVIDSHTPGAPLHPHPVTVVPTPALGPLGNNVVAWDSESKEVTVKAGTPETRFTFNLTNVSSSNVTIKAVQTSCGCTAAHLPQMPWTLSPGAKGQFDVTMNLLGKMGSVTKVVTINSDQGTKSLLVKSIIEPAPAVAAGGTEPAMADRTKNQQLALADRQAVFKGDCAKCHVEPTVGKTGKELYAAACGICHDAEHRATMVPNLHALNHETNAEYWKNWIERGKADSLMPAFSVKEGGILTDAQIASLVNFLSTTIPQKATAQVATPPNSIQ
jgi:mono/diheme cytochrome c family protein